MKRLYHTTVLAAALLITSGAMAQTSDITTQRRCLDQAITTIEDYESMATIGDDETRYDFIALFSDGATVYNDLPGMGTGESLPVEDYCQRLTTGLHNRKVTIKNIRTESIAREGNRWKVSMSFDKSVAFVNECGIFFSSDDIYSKDYRLTAIMEYDPQAGQCKIQSITGQKMTSELPEHFIVFEKSDPRDGQLGYRDSRGSQPSNDYLPLQKKFNRYNQAFLRKPLNNADFKYADPDVTITPVVDEQCNKVSMAYKARKLRLRLHYDIGLGSAFSLDASDALTTKTSSSSFGLEMGYIFPSKGQLKAGVFLGVGITNAKVELGMTSADYHYSTDADVDGDTYARHYHDLSLTQTAKLSELNIPVYLDLDYRFSAVVSAYADLGVKANLNLSAKMDKTEGSAYVDGTYPAYNNLVMNEEWGYNGFGQHSYGKEDLDSDELAGISSTTFDALLGAGLRINIPSTPLTFDLGVNYRMGLTEMTTSDRSGLDIASDGRQPVVYNTISGLSSTEHVRNMTDALQSIKRQALKLTIGIIYKF